MVSNFSNGDIAEKGQELWENHFSATAGESKTKHDLFDYEYKSGQTSNPVFMSLDLETPLGFATFLANTANQRKVFIPSSFNMSTILRSVSR